MSAIILKEIGISLCTVAVKTCIKLNVNRIVDLN